MEPRTYKFNNSTLTIVFGDITTSKADVIVSSDDTGISMGGGISGAILKAGGVSILQDAQKKLPAQIGDVVVSTAGTMEHQKFIFHCLTIPHDKKQAFYDEKLSNPEDVNHYILQHSVDKCFRLLQALDLTSIAFPTIGAGLAHIPLGDVAKVMADTISSNLCRSQKEYHIELYLYDRNHILKEMDYIDLFEHFAVRSAIAKMSKDEIPFQEELVRKFDKNVVRPKRSEMQHEVFISYSRKDEENVLPLKALLDENSVSYWIDKDGIFSGENFKEVIVDAIETAKVVIFVSSVNSNTSRYVIREIGCAVQRNKTIIPLMLDNSPYAKSIAYDIGDIDQIDYTEPESANNKLIASLAYALGK